MTGSYSLRKFKQPGANQEFVRSFPPPKMVRALSERKRISFNAGNKRLTLQSDLSAACRSVCEVGLCTDTLS